MSQADIDAFVASVRDGELPSEGVTAAVVTRGIPVNGGHSGIYDTTALHFSMFSKRSELVVALLAAGADPNVSNTNGVTSVWCAAMDSTADILQLVIDGGGNANKPCNNGQTPLIALVRYNKGDAAVRLKVLLACPDLDLDAQFLGKTAEEWAAYMSHVELASAIAEEQAKRERWSALRASWIVATIASTVALSII
jgi:ankyrin repeat protein